MYERDLNTSSRPTSRCNPYCLLVKLVIEPVESKVRLV